MWWGVLDGEEWVFVLPTIGIVGWEGEGVVDVSVGIVLVLVDSFPRIWDSVTTPTFEAQHLSDTPQHQRSLSPEPVHGVICVVLSIS